MTKATNVITDETCIIKQASQETNVITEATNLTFLRKPLPSQRQLMSSNKKLSKVRLMCNFIHKTKFLSADSCKLRASCRDLSGSGSGWGYFFLFKPN